MIKDRLKIIEKEIEELEVVIEQKDQEHYKKYENDINGAFNMREKYQEFLNNRKPYISKLSELNREKRMIMPYKLSEKSKYGDVMTLKHFISCVKSGGFIDYDGYGLYIKDNMETDIEIYPSDIKHKSIRKEFDKIIWFNR